MTAEILNLSFIIVLPLMQLSNIIALYRVTNIVHGNKSLRYPVWFTIVVIINIGSLLIIFY